MKKTERFSIAKSTAHLNIRLEPEIKALIEQNRRKLRISQAEYVARLVRADYK